MTIKEWALTYARRGWPVFPCHPKSKRPLVKGDLDADGKEIAGSGGVKRASTSPDTITAWWTKWPRANIGLATGARSGVFVVDLDAGTDEATGEVFEALALLRALAYHLEIQIPSTWWTSTPRGGRHLFFQFPPDDPVGNRGAMLPRIDVRGEGGYVILPPSARDDGKVYAWGAKPTLADELPAKAPPELLDCIHKRGQFEPAARVDFSAQPGGRKNRQGATSIAERALAARGPSSSKIDASVASYVEAAFRLEIDAVKTAGKGERNNRLNLAALRLGELVHAGAFTAGDVEAELSTAALASGLLQDDGSGPVRATIMSGLAKGLRQPRDLTEVRAKAAERAVRGTGARPPEPPPPASADFETTLPTGERSQMGEPVKPAGAKGGGKTGNGKKPPGDEDADQRALDRHCAFLPMTDLGNAERFRDRQRSRLLWCPAIGWLWWDGRRWSVEMADAKVLAAEHLTVRAIQHEAAWLAESDRDTLVKERKAPGRRKKGEPKEFETVMLSDILAQFGRASESKPRMRISDDAKAYLAIATAQLDGDPFKINCRNATLSMRRTPEGGAEIVSSGHDPADYITKLAPVLYDPDAICVEYDAFLEMVQPSAQMRRFLSQWGGYSLCGDTSEQMFTFNWGKGKNGKSTLLNAWGFVAGDYGRSVRIETFLDQGKSTAGGAPTPDLAMLKGVRYLRTSEPERGAKLAEALIKLATGSEPMNVRHLNKEFFELIPNFKLTMSGNYKPGIVGTDEGIWRRVKLVPWTIEVPADKRIKDFDRVKLAPEASGILNRLLAGLLDWMEHGLVEPDEVVKATAQYREDSDPLGRALAACVIYSTEARIQSSEWHRLFCAWAKANGEREWTPTGLGRAMRERGFVSKHSDVNYWEGIKAGKSVSDFIDHDGNPWRTAGAADKGSAESQAVSDDMVTI